MDIEPIDAIVEMLVLTPADRSTIAAALAEQPAEAVEAFAATLTDDDPRAPLVEAELDARAEGA